jgi:hypothetical protein
MRMFVASCLLLALPAASPAYDIEQLRKDARAYHDAMMRKLGDLTIEQEAAFTAPDRADVTVRSTIFRKGNRWRTEGSMTAPAGSAGEGTGSSAIHLFDGTDLWSAAMGMKRRLPPGQTYGQGTPAYWTEPVPGSEIVGEETVAGRDCWIVLGPEPPPNPILEGTRARTWVDKKCFLTVQSESRMSGKTMRAVFSDFRRVEGYDLPYRTEVYSDGAKTLAAQVVSLAAGRGLSDDLFDAARLPGTEAGGGPGQGGLDAILQQVETVRKQTEEPQEPQKQQGK